MNDNESNAVLVLPISTLSIHMWEDEHPLKMSLTERKSYFSMRSAHGVYFLYYKEKVLSGNEINEFIIFPNNFVNPFVERHRYNDI